MPRDAVVEDYERLVYSIIKRFTPYYDKEDLYQAGMLGLSKALKKYDQTYNNTFSTYAYKHILGEVLSFIREDKNIKVSKDLIRLSRKMEEVLAQRMERNPSLTELSLFLEIPEDVLVEAEQSKIFVQSLDQALMEDEEKDLTLYDAIPFEEKGYDSDIQDLRRELERLPEEERRLIEERYFQDKTQSEASKELGMSQVQVSRCEAKILTKLQQRLVA